MYVHVMSMSVKTVASEVKFHDFFVENTVYIDIQYF